MDKWEKIVMWAGIVFLFALLADFLATSRIYNYTGDPLRERSPKVRQEDYQPYINELSQ